MMYKWYADDSALKKDYNGKKKHVYLFGGILISRKDEIELSKIIRNIKSEFTGPDMPIKFNMRDTKIKEVYKRFNKIEEYELLLAESATWRKKIIQESLKLDYKIYISCIENLQADKKEQKQIKENLSSFLFSNALMRVGLFAKLKNPDHVQVILDWPEGNNSQPFDKEYFYAYHHGKNASKIEFYSGKLKDLNFDQTLYYARCNHSNLLQFSDIILGATRDWIETELQNREYSIGKELAEIFLSKFSGYPKEIIGYGINIASNNHNFKKELQEIMKKYDL